MFLIDFDLPDIISTVYQTHLPLSYPPIEAWTYPLPMDKETLIARLKRQRQLLEQELTERIVNIENITASIQSLEGRDIFQTSYPPHNPFEGVPVGRISTETYLTIARRLVNNKDKARVPGVPAKVLIKELNTRVGEAESIINSLDNEAERISGRGDPDSRRHLRQLFEDRDKLRIEVEFYKDIIEALQTEPKKNTKEEVDEARLKAKDWYRRRNPGKP